jgi:hypothetical protein
MLELEHTGAVTEQLRDLNPDAWYFEGLDGAIVGIVERCGQSPIAVYDQIKCLEILVQDHGYGYDEAVEHFQYNLMGLYTDGGTPCFLWRIAKS